jgi:hypothetical protein
MNMKKLINHWFPTLLLAVVFAAPVLGGEYFEREGVAIGG